jgi:hypothetical protein
MTLCSPVSSVHPESSLGRTSKYWSEPEYIPCTGRSFVPACEKHTHFLHLVLNNAPAPGLILVVVESPSGKLSESSDQSVKSSVLVPVRYVVNSFIDEFTIYCALRATAV